LFYKDISDFIFADTRLVGAGTNNGFDGEYEGFALSTSSNGGSAKVEGFELNYSQQLTGLPGVLKHLGILANYTRIKTKGDYGTTDERSTDEIAGFIPESGNAGISFVRGPIDIRLLWNFTGTYLAAFSTSPAQLQYNAPRDLFTIKTKWRINRNYSLYFDARNITNTPGQDIYTYIPSRTFNWNRGSPSYYFGMAARF
jgi:outer membrane receptor protein involved in Fe transport